MFFQFNPALSGASPSSIRAAVDQSIADYFIENTGKFAQVFRLSNLLTDIDATDPSVLSSRANVIVNRRIVPQLATTRDYTVSFPTPIRDAQQSTSASVYSSQFSYENRTVTIRNKLDQRTQISGPGVTPVIFEVQATNTLEMIDTEGEIVLDNVGSYDKLTGNVTITSLTVQSVPNSVNYIKVFAVPANQSVINSVRNNIVKYDADQSFLSLIHI